jgi:hypothetical protein
LENSFHCQQTLLLLVRTTTLVFVNCFTLKLLKENEEINNPVKSPAEKKAKIVNFKTKKGFFFFCLCIFVVVKKKKTHLNPFPDPCELVFCFGTAIILLV